MPDSIIYVVSDSVGETAEVFTNAALIQFHDHKFHLKRRSFIEDLAQIDEIVDEALVDDAIIVYTLIKNEMRAYLELRAKEKGLYSYDIFGTFIEIVERKYNTSAALELGLTHRLDEQYFQKIEAVEFAVKYDDGRDPSGILKSDIVLLGVSRTSKTPLSQNLAHKGYKVTNIPIVPEVDPPEELFQIDPAKCVGLVTTPEQLMYIRKERLKSLGLNDDAIYADINRIEAELAYFNQIIQKVGCTVLDVSNKAIEETAYTIDQLLKHTHL